jgi:hypothetical protein
VDSLCGAHIAENTGLRPAQALEEYSLSFDVSRARGLSCGNKEVAEVFMPTARDIGRPPEGYRLSPVMFTCTSEAILPVGGR